MIDHRRHPPSTPWPTPPASDATRGTGFARPRLLILTATLLVNSAMAAAAEPTTVEQFNEQQSRWRQLVGTRLTIEGRCPGWSPQRLLMTKCEMVFEFADDLTVPRSKPGNIIVSGRIEEHGARLVFMVDSIRTRPGDEEQLGIDRGRIDVNSPDEWYGLADWARRRAAFYEDEELDAEATELYRQGVQAEYRRTAADDSAGLVALAGKTRRFGLPDRLRMEFLHEAAVRELDAARSGKRPGFATVMTHALDWLPGAGRPLLEYNDDMQAREAAYLKEPHDTYADAEDDQRRILERLLYINAALANISADAQQDGRNGFAIAERIEATVPEREELAEEYRRREIKWRTDNIARATREDMLLLADRLEKRDEPARAFEARRAWLEAQTPRLKRTVSGQLELAKEYLDLLDDERAAVEVYRELYRSPQSRQLAATRLQDLGYTYDGEEWRSDSLPSDESDLATAIRNGSVREGMTQADVRAVLGKPDSTLRFAQRGQVVELWVYPGPGISIHFARHRPEEEQVAIEVFNLPVSTREQLQH